MDLSLGEIQMNNHERFKKRLIGSRQALFRVAEWLHQYGYYIAIPPMKIRKENEDPKDFFDDGDLFITKEGSPRKRIETKGLSVTFTNAMDWPYGDPLVSNKAAVDRGIEEVEAYISVSSDMDHIVIIKTDTKEHWYVKELIPKTTGRPEQFYCCPIEYAVFKDISRKKEP